MCKTASICFNHCVFLLLFIWDRFVLHSKSLIQHVTVLFNRMTDPFTDFSGQLSTCFAGYAFLWVKIPRFISSMLYYERGLCYLWFDLKRCALMLYSFNGVSLPAEYRTLCKYWPLYIKMLKVSGLMESCDRKTITL